MSQGATSFGEREEEEEEELQCQWGPSTMPRAPQGEGLQRDVCVLNTPR